MERWPGVWRAIDARRIALGMSWAAVYEKAAVSETTVRKMKAGVPLERPDKRASLSLALQWGTDGIDRLLAGVEPLSSPAAAEAGELSLAAEVARLRRDLLALTVEVVALRTQIGPTPAQPADRQAGQA